MLKIKLTRIGKRDQAQYRIVVAPDRSKNRGNVSDIIGFYNPLTTPATITLDKVKYADWLQKGARPTDTVKRLAEKSTK